MTQCYSCGAQIKFEASQVSKNGRPIPLELYGAVHNCPNKKFKNKIMRVSSSSESVARPSAAEKAWTSHQIGTLVNFVQNLQRETKLLEERLTAIERRLTA